MMATPSEPAALMFSTVPSLHERNPAARTLGAGRRILHVASHCSSPDDAGGALAAAQAELGADVRLLLPADPSLTEGLGVLFVEARLGDGPGEVAARLLRGAAPGSGLPVWLFDCGDLGRSDDDAARCHELLCRAAARLALGDTAVKWRPDVVHCHGWRTGLVPMLLKASGRHAPASVFAVPAAALATAADAMGAMPDEPDTAGGEPRSFLAAGIAHADKLIATGEAADGYADCPHRSARAHLRLYARLPRSEPARPTRAVRRRPAHASSPPPRHSDGDPRIKAA